MRFTNNVKCLFVLFARYLLSFYSSCISVRALCFCARASFMFELLQLLTVLSHMGQNYWTLIGSDRGHIFLITRALFGKEGMIT